MLCTKQILQWTKRVGSMDADHCRKDRSPMIHRRWEWQREAVSANKGVGLIQFAKDICFPYSKIQIGKVPPMLLVDKYIQILLPGWCWLAWGQSRKAFFCVPWRTHSRRSITGWYIVWHLEFVFKEIYSVPCIFFPSPFQDWFPYHPPAILLHILLQVSYPC